MQNTYQKKIYAWAATICGALLSLTALYSMGISPMETWTYRILFCTFSYIVIASKYPFKTKSTGFNIALDFLFVALLVGTSGYLIVNLNRLIVKLQYASTTVDTIVCIIGVFLTLVAVYKTNGIVMPLLAGFFLTYCWWGRYIPGALGTKGYSLSRIFATCYSTDGVFGQPLGVTATYVILFTLLGAVLEGTGGTNLFIGLSTALAGKFRGGAAKVAIIASGLMGMITGSSAANAVTTGAFTIPLMKQSKYNDVYAAAVCAVASTGGQIMPPIMGAGAFILAENIGWSYSKVCIAAIIPALLYYLSLFFSVDLESVRLKMHGLPKELLPKVKNVMKEYGHLSLSLIVLIILLAVLKSSAVKAGLYACYTALIVALFRKNTRYSLKKLFAMLSDGGKSSISVASACATAGIITGVLSLTGLGGKMATMILALANGHLLVALILVMIVCIILGMGLPTTASYIIASSVTVAPLTKLGMTPLAANMFIFYFACISAITPPVALAAYAAAGIADCSPARAGYKAWWLGLASFIVPYMFVFSPELLLQSDSVLYIIYCSVTACIGVKFFSHFIAGHFVQKKMPIPVRTVLLVGSLMMVMAGLVTDSVGIALIVLCYCYQKFLNKSVDITVEAAT